ncbi:MAG: SpoIIE family protein phosphatase [Acidobacteria bacterium]|nr:SpoIIE family protein phosphatase [Acidobacteriota bacterium]
MGRLRDFEIKIFRRLHREAPASKVHRTAFWLLMLYLALSLGKFLPGTAGSIFETLSVLTFLLLLAACLPLVWRWVFGRLLWKVRNRLIVTYLLMGLAPLVLFVMLAIISLYMFSGQFAIFAATAAMNTELEHIATNNRDFSLHVAHVEGAARGTLKEITLPEIQDTSPEQTFFNLKVSVFQDGRQIGVLPARVSDHEIDSVPAWAKDRFRAVVLDHNKLYLRAIDIQEVNGHRTTVISSMPLEKANVDQVARGLGTITVMPNVGLDDSQSAEAIEARSEADKKLLKQEVRALTITGGILPRPQNFYDVTVRFYAPLETIDWTTGKLQETLTQVNSRPSLLYQRLFITSLKIAAIVQDLLIGIAVFFGLLELIAFFMAMRLNRTITRSVNDLYDATVAIDKGNLAHRIKVTRNDQLATLSHSFNRMTSSLERLLAEQREKERMQNELAIAQEVQANLFPQSRVSMPMLDLYGVCYPARSVSGDYYDFLVFRDSALGIALGDISGKGISAALLMATLHSAVRAYRFAGEELVAPNPAKLGAALKSDDNEGGVLFEDPARVLAMLNRHLYRSTQPEKYATLFLAHYDGNSHQLVYSNGGQLPPLVLRADNSVTRLDCGGTVVGLIDGADYEQGTETLYSGDIVIAYSDGVTEPENEFGDFGEERLLEVVRRHRHLPLEAISEQVMHALRAWIGSQEQPDDITLVLARQR